VGGGGGGGRGLFFWVKETYEYFRLHIFEYKIILKYRLLENLG